MDLFDLSAKLTLDTSEYDRGLDSAEGEASSFGSKLGGGLAKAGKVAGAGLMAVGTAVAGITTATVSGMKKTAEYGDQIDKQSQRLGVSAKTYQEYDYIMQLAGTSMDQVSAGMKTLTTQIGKATAGTKESAERFKKLGINMNDLKKMSREDIFKATIAGLQNMEDSTERATLANELFGKSGQNLTPLFNMTNEQTQELIGNLNEMGAVMSDESVKASADFQDAITTLQAGMSGLKNGVMGELLPAGTEIINGLTALFGGDSSTGLGMINEGINSVIDSVSKAIPKIIDVGVSIVESLATAILENAPTLIQTATDLITTLLEKFVEILPDLIKVGLDMILSLATGIGNALPDLIPTVIDTLLTIVDTLLNNVDQIIDAGIQLIIGLAEGLINAIPQLIAKIPQIITSLLNAIVTNAPKLLTGATKLVTTLAEGFVKSFPQFLAQIPSLIKNLLNAILNFGSAMWDAGKNLVKGLWDGFKAMWSSFVDSVFGLAKSLINGVLSIFGIHSPSKVFAEIGGYLAEGMGVGWEDEYADTKKTIMSDLDFSATPIELPTIDVQNNATADNQPMYANVNVVLEGDAQGLFRLVRQESTKFERSTGVSAFA